MTVLIRELSSSILLYSPGTEVISIIIWRLWENGQYVELSALGVMLISAFVFFVAVLGFFLYAIRPVIQAWTLETTPQNMGGSAIGLLFGAQALGSSVAPLLGGVIADRWGLSATFYFLAATIVCANLFILAMPRGTGGRRAD